MNILYTDVDWQLTNHCKAECYYCPISLRGGNYPEEDKDYLKLVSLITDHYNSKLGRRIRWGFDGGEPLDLHNLVKVLNRAKSDLNSVTLHTNGGNLWIDWWAIAPNIDHCVLTYHYWQNPNLIKYVIDCIKKENKTITVKAPVRPDNFEEDMDRIRILEEERSINVVKVVLYKDANPIGGQYPYTKEQLLILSGIDPNKKAAAETAKAPLIKERTDFETKTHHQRLEEKKASNPSYLGKLCNVGIERLRISHNGYVNGSNCNNQPLGNIWNEGWTPPEGPQTCAMLACMNPWDQKITKFI